MALRYSDKQADLLPPWPSICSQLYRAVPETSGIKHWRRPYLLVADVAHLGLRDGSRGTCWVFMAE